LIENSTFFCQCIDVELRRIPQDKRSCLQTHCIYTIHHSANEDSWTRRIAHIYIVYVYIVTLVTESLILLLVFYINSRSNTSLALVDKCNY